MSESEAERTGAPLIGLTTYHRNGDNKFDLSAEYVDSVRRAGGIPLLVPPGAASALREGYKLRGGGEPRPRLRPIALSGHVESDATSLRMRHH